MSGLDGTHHGRTADEWDQLTAEATRFLIERARLEKVTSYTELNVTVARRTGLRPFDFEQQDERTAMGVLLGRVVNETVASTGVMLSSLVHYLDANDAGPGFYALAQDLGLLPRNASRVAKETFWIGQVRAVHARYRSTTG